MTELTKRSINYSTKFLYLTFILVELVRVISRLNHGYYKESWQITEWLINYQGGFVRRGLLGEMILFLYDKLGVNPYILIISISSLAYGILILFFIIIFVRRDYSLAILPFAFFIGGPAINDFWIRKDVLLILIFIPIIIFSIRKGKLAVILVNSMLTVGILIHEAIGFFSLPILFFLFYQIENSRCQQKMALRNVLNSFSKLFPTILVFILVLYFKGSYLIAEKIWNSWQEVPFPYISNSQYSPPASIDGLSWSLIQGLSYSYSILFNFADGIYAPLIWLLIICCIFYIVITFFSIGISNETDWIKTIKKIDNLANILLFQFITLIPLFALGWDYGRWIFFWITSSFIVLIFVPEETISKLVIQKFRLYKVITRIIYRGRVGRSINTLCFLPFFIGVPAYGWSLAGFIDSSPFFLILNSISGLIKNSFLLLGIMG